MYGPMFEAIFNEITFIAIKAKAIENKIV